MDTKQWIKDFVKDKYGINVTDEMENEPILGETFHMSPPEIAFLVVETGKHFDVPIAGLVDGISEEITFSDFGKLISSFR